jgi:plastocyanin
VTKRLLVAFAALALASLALAACGSSDDSSSTSAASTPASTTDSGGGGATVDIAADPSGTLAFTKTDLSTTAGSDTIDFDNESSTPHNVQIEDADGNAVGGTDTITGSSTSTTADLKPGTYTFFCDIPGHREAGMEGTITVK